MTKRSSCEENVTPNENYTCQMHSTWSTIMNSTLNIRHVFLVLVNFTAVDCEAESFQQLSSLLILSFTTVEQVEIQWGTLSDDHACCNHITTFRTDQPADENTRTISPHKYGMILNNDDDDNNNNNNPKLPCLRYFDILPFLPISYHKDDLCSASANIHWTNSVTLRTCNACNTVCLPSRSLNVVRSCVIRLSITVRQDSMQVKSVWKKLESIISSNASRFHARRVYW